MTPESNPLDVPALIAIARAATPGNWPEATWYGSMDGGFAAIGPHHLTPDGESDEPGGVAETRALADARFIAAFNPSTALALLDRLEAAEKAVDECLLRDEFNKGQREKAIARIAALDAENAKLRNVAIDGLRSMMREWSEENCCAGWLSGLDELIASDTTESTVAIRALADCVGGWWRWDHTKQRENFFPMEVWRTLAALETRKGE